MDAVYTDAYSSSAHTIPSTYLKQRELNLLPDSTKYFCGHYFLGIFNTFEYSELVDRCLIILPHRALLRPNIITEIKGRAMKSGAQVVQSKFVVDGIYQLMG